MEGRDVARFACTLRKMTGSKGRLHSRESIGRNLGAWLRDGLWALV